MLYLGCHLSSASGYEAMGKTALSIGANTFAWFCRNPRGARFKAPAPSDLATLIDLVQTHAFGPLVCHAPYTYNLCSAKPEVVEFGREAMRQDLQLLDELPHVYYNFHPGSHTGQGAEKGIELVASGLNEILFEGMRTTVLLETMAGKGTEVGRSFDELAAILDKTKLSEYVGVCLDTCHISDAGYDIRADLDAVLNEFDKVIGLEKLCALHLNDSKNPCGSHKDRHELLGQGTIGLDTFKHIVNNTRLQGLPMILETPNDVQGYAREIALLRDMED